MTWAPPASGGIEIRGYTVELDGVAQDTTAPELTAAGLTGNTEHADHACNPPRQSAMEGGRTADFQTHFGARV